MLPGFLRLFCLLQVLCEELTHRLCGFFLRLVGGVSVGSEGEAGICVSQHTGDRSDVDAVLDGVAGESVPKIMKSDVFQSRAFKDFRVQSGDGIGVVHSSSDRRGEHVRIVRMLFVFLDQQVNGFLRHRFCSDGSGSLGS